MSFVPQTVLVTGAMGQVGRRVTELLLTRGRTVVALDLRTPETEAVATSLVPQPGYPGTLVPAYVDLLDEPALTSLVAERRPEAIVHLAAVVSPTCYSNPELGRRVNVGGTVNLVRAAQALGTSPLFIEASSSAVYGSRNPHTQPERLVGNTPVNPVDCYGEDKVRAEAAVAESGLPHATLRLGGILSPDMLGGGGGPEFAVLRRAFPRDGRIHVVDCRDVALAFANAVDRGQDIDGTVLLIGGNETYVMRQGQLEDDILGALGIGAIGEAGGLPGDPSDERGWGLTDWFDTTQAEKLLEFQRHDWNDTLDWLAKATGRKRAVLSLVGPLLRLLMVRQTRRLQAKEGRGPYAAPWSLIEQHFGSKVLAPTDW